MLSNIPFPSLFVCFLIFLAWLHFEKRKNQREESQTSDAFWAREQEANQTRNKDISRLPQYRPDIDKIPMPNTEDENVQYYQNEIKNHVGDTMMNLSQYTNTDLKLAYGVGNFKTLCDYDTNFNDFLMNLSNLGGAYRKVNLLKDAVTVFELCLDAGSDKSTDYLSLGALYVEQNDRTKLYRLIERAEQSELPLKESLLSSLKRL